MQLGNVNYQCKNTFCITNVVVSSLPFVYFRYDTPYDTDMTVVRISDFFC